MPQEAIVPAYMPEALIVALEQVAEEQKWALAETLEHARQALVREWNAGRMSRRNDGQPPYSPHKRIWIPDKVTDALRHLRRTDGVRLSVVIQDAFDWSCGQQGSVALVSNPADPTE